MNTGHKWPSGEESTNSSLFVGKKQLKADALSWLGVWQWSHGVTKWYPRGCKDFLQTASATLPGVASMLGKLALVCVGASILQGKGRVIWEQWEAGCLFKRETRGGGDALEGILLNFSLTTYSKDDHFGPANYCLLSDTPRDHFSGSHATPPTCLKLAGDPRTESFQSTGGSHTQAFSPFFTLRNHFFQVQVHSEAKSHPSRARCINILWGCFLGLGRNNA